MRRFMMLGLTAVTLACGGSTSDGLSGDKDGGGAGGSTGGGTSGGNGGTGGVGTGGSGTGGIGTGGSAGGAAAGGSGGIATGGVGNGGVGGIATGGTGGNAAAGGTGGTGGNATFCSSLCQKISAAQCPNEDPYNACFAGCQVDMPAYQAACGAETSSFMGCALGPGVITCDQDGESRVTGCNNQLVEWVKCAGCIPSTGDDACDACTKSSCCSQLNAVYDHPQFPAYLACVYTCSTQSCVQSCFVQNSALQSVFTTLAQCQGASCAAC